MIDVSTFMFADAPAASDGDAAYVRSVSWRVVPLDFFGRNLLHMKTFIVDSGDKTV